MDAKLEKFLRDNGLPILARYPDGQVAVKCLGGHDVMYGINFRALDDGIGAAAHFTSRALSDTEFKCVEKALAAEAPGTTLEFCDGPSGPGLKLRGVLIQSNFWVALENFVDGCDVLYIASLYGGLADMPVSTERLLGSCAARTTRELKPRIH